jgi:hypothetical protein
MESLQSDFDFMIKNFPAEFTVGKQYRKRKSNRNANTTSRDVNVCYAGYDKVEELLTKQKLYSIRTQISEEVARLVTFYLLICDLYCTYTYHFRAVQLAPYHPTMHLFGGI